MDMFEVVEIETGARMSRSPKTGEFVGVDYSGIPRFCTPVDLMGTTIFESIELAAQWIRTQSLDRTHKVVLAL